MAHHNPALQQLIEWCAANYQEVAFVKCPFCQQEIAETWQPLLATTDTRGNALPTAVKRLSFAVPKRNKTMNEDTHHLSSVVEVSAVWMQCPNQQCLEAIVKVVRSEIDRIHISMRTGGHDDQISDKKEWIAVPKTTIPSVNSLVPERYARDYREAWTIVSDSHRMSAVLARRILADLLKEYARLAGNRLTKDVDTFIADTHHPISLRQKLHHLREMGDFGAHTQEDESSGAIIDIDSEEAVWTLQVVEDLFEYFIVGPAKDKAIMDAMNEKIKKANRNPVKPLDK